MGVLLGSRWRGPLGIPARATLANRPYGHAGRVAGLPGDCRRRSGLPEYMNSTQMQLSVTSMLAEWVRNRWATAIAGVRTAIVVFCGWYDTHACTPRERSERCAAVRGLRLLASACVCLRLLPAASGCFRLLSAATWRTTPALLLLWASHKCIDGTPTGLLPSVAVARQPLLESVVHV